MLKKKGHMLVKITFWRTAALMSLIEVFLRLPYHEGERHLTSQQQWLEKECGTEGYKQERNVCNVSLRG